MNVGIEAINFYGGCAKLDVATLAHHRSLDKARFENLLMIEKTITLPFEDSVSYAINAAKPIIDALDQEEKNSIELLITATESSIDFGKSLSTYVHHYLGLNKNCRLFEIKQACYSGVAGLQMAINFILSQASPGAKALVIPVDITRLMLTEKQQASEMDWAFIEPSSGAGAVSMLISDSPKVFQIDIGANGYYGYEVMDACRPLADMESGDSDLSLLSYLDCCENAYKAYEDRVADVHYKDTFDYLAFHTPFGGMVKGAHRMMMRKFAKANSKEIEVDFEKRVLPGLTYCQKVGNTMGATTMLSLLSTIDCSQASEEKRVGIFSYGSGCCSEFFSGIFDGESQAIVRQAKIKQQLDERYELSIERYDELLKGNNKLQFGTRNIELSDGGYPEVIENLEGKDICILSKIDNFHREYKWI